MYRAEGRPAPVGVTLPAADQAPKNLAQLNTICARHQVLDLYIWLANKFPDTFLDLQQANAQRDYAQSLIVMGLKNLAGVTQKGYR